MLAALARTLTITSQPGSTARWETIALIRRRILFRFTAPPTNFGVVNPKRVDSRPVRSVRMTIASVAKRLPSRYTAAKSARCLSRCDRSSATKPTSQERQPLDTKLVAAFLATCLQDLPSASGAHAGAKAMGTLTRNSFWLVGSLWHYASLSEMLDQYRYGNRVRQTHRQDAKSSKRECPYQAVYLSISQYLSPKYADGPASAAISSWRPELHNGRPLHRCRSSL